MLIISRSSGCEAILEDGSIIDLNNPGEEIRHKILTAQISINSTDDLEIINNPQYLEILANPNCNLFIGAVDQKIIKKIMLKFERIGGNADFKYLAPAKGLETLVSVGGNAYFGNLASAEGLEALVSIGGGANFSRLTSAEGLEALVSIGGNAYFGT